MVGDANAIGNEIGFLSFVRAREAETSWMRCDCLAAITWPISLD